MVNAIQWQFEFLYANRLSYFREKEECTEQQTQQQGGVLSFFYQ